MNGVDTLFNNNIDKFNFYNNLMVIIFYNKFSSQKYEHILPGENQYYMGKVFNKIFKYYRHSF